MKKLALTTLLLTSVFATSAFANPNHGGFQDPNAPQQMQKQGKHHKHGGGFANTTQATSQVSDVANMKDDQYVVLQGKLVSQVGKKEFLFRDASGEITVEIERKAWHGQDVTPNDEIKLYGEVDKSWNKTEIEIHRVEKVK